MSDILEDSNTNQIYILLALLFLLFYSIISSFLQNRHWPIHRGAVAIIVGIIVGFVLFISSDATYELIVKVNDTIVFAVLYPPMVFATGYNFKKNAFVKNIKFIILFGVIGTFICFFIVAALMYAANQLNLIRDAKDVSNIRTLSIWEVILLSACLCSIDTVASEEAVSQTKYPKLYSTIFGQGIFKDTITIVLFRSILNLEQVQTPSKFVFYWWTIFQVLLNFLIIILSSSLIGIITAFIITYLFKKFRFLLESQGVSETCVLFLFGFAVYISAELVNASGVIAILIFGITLNHFNVYNLSEQGKSNSKATFSVIETITEGTLFLMMGMMVWQVSWTDESAENQMTHSWIFIAVVILILIFSRIVNVVVIGVIAGKIFPTLKFGTQQLKILFISGLVRGATPFALFTSVQLAGGKQYAKNEGLVLKSTIIIIVMISSIFLNSLIPKIYKNSLKKLSAEGIKQALITVKEKKEKKNTPIKNSIISKFKNFDEKYLKPFLIYNYRERKDQINQIKQIQKQNKLLQVLEKDKNQGEPYEQLNILNESINQQNH